MTALITRYAPPVLRFTVTTVLPAVVLTLVAVLVGLVRTTALLGFLALVLLRAGMVGLERLAEACPGPRLVPANPLGGER